MGEVREFRSRILELPEDCRADLGEISFQKGMRATTRKNRAIETLKKFDVPFTEVGTGTNRFIFKYDGFAMKLALDREGVADNRQEWVMSDMLPGGQCPAHEVSKGGHLLVASYAPAFTSYPEMTVYSQKIRQILSSWSSRYLLGDVGFNRVNYANWGLLNGEPVCIDYAYVFPASMNLFRCNCGCFNLTFTDESYSTYKCVECGRHYEDRVLRAKISQETRIKLFNDVEGIEMMKPLESHIVDDKYLLKDRNPDGFDADLTIEESYLSDRGFSTFWSR